MEGKPADYGKIRTLYEQGFSDLAIAQRCNVATSTVAKFRYKNGLPHWEAERSKRADAERFPLYHRGLSDAKIAEQLHISEGAVYKWRKKHNLPPNHPECSYKLQGVTKLQEAKKSRAKKPEDDVNDDLVEVLPTPRPSYPVVQNADVLCKECGMSYGTYTAYMRMIEPEKQEDAHNHLKAAWEAGEERRKEWKRHQSNWYEDYDPRSW